MNRTISHKLTSALTKITLAAALITLAACNSGAPLSDEAQLRAVLEKMELGAETRSLSDIMDHVSNNYKDPKGNDIEALKKLIRFQFIRNQNINIFSKVNEIEVLEKAATVEMSLAMTSGKLDLSKPTNRLRADTFKFSLLFSREKNLWLLKSGTWQQGW